MRRILLGAITIIIMLAAFMFLWLSNPLYTFVGAVVFVVFLVVGFSFLINHSHREENAKVAKDLKPRRTGEFRRLEHVEKPEESWDGSGSKQRQDQRMRDKKETSRQSTQVQPVPGPTPEQKPITPGNSGFVPNIVPEKPASIAESTVEEEVVEIEDNIPIVPAPDQQSYIEPKPTGFLGRREPAPEIPAPPPPQPAPINEREAGESWDDLDEMDGFGTAFAEENELNIVDEDGITAKEELIVIDTKKAEQESEEPSEPEPVLTDRLGETKEKGDSPDFDSMTSEEMMQWMESLSKRQGASEAYSTGANLGIEDLDEIDEWLKSEYKPYDMSDEDWAKVRTRMVQERATQNSPDTGQDAEQAAEEGKSISLTDTAWEDTGALNISDEDILEAEESLIDGKSEYDYFAQEIRQKIDSGKLGESPEEIEAFFRSAFEKAAQRKDLDEPDYDEDDDLAWVDDSFADDTDEFDLAEEIPDFNISNQQTEELPDWLQESVEQEKGGADEIFIPDTLLEDNEEETDAPDTSITASGSSNFDLMGMVGSLPAEKQQEFFALMTEIPIGEQTETQLIQLYEKLVNGSEDKKLSEAQFTAYFPRQAAANTEYGFYVYAHLSNALIEADIQQFQTELGGRVPKPKVAEQTARIQEGAALAVMIQCDKLKFNQLGAMQQWHEPYVRFDFKFTAEEALVDEMVEGRIAILMGMIEIASIDFQLVVIPPNPLAVVTAMPNNPLTAQNFDSTATASLYQKIFISYSRKDTVIAEQYRKVQMMAGNIIFMDTHSIRAGEDWELALKRFIDEADVFQLFWSKHSAASGHVRFEWDYALNQRCPDTRCVQFIRPAYWEKPMVAIPPELGHLHFAFVEMNLGD